MAAMALALVLTSGVAWAVNKVGTNGPDTLRGTDWADKLAGRGGNDILLALAGNDKLQGGRGKDVVNGGSLARPFGGKKNLDGGRGNDAVQGGLGPDRISGGQGNDFMVDGDFNPRIQREDRLSGGAGKDVIIVVNRPAFEDLVSCGSGFDRVWADREDLVAPDCERVFLGFASADRFFRSIPERFFAGLHPRFT